LVIQVTNENVKLRHQLAQTQKEVINLQRKLDEVEKERNKLRLQLEQTSNGIAHFGISKSEIKEGTALGSGASGDVFKVKIFGIFFSFHLILIQNFLFSRQFGSRLKLQ